MSSESKLATTPEAAYWNFLKQGKFMIQRCGGCRQHVFYPRLLCPHCGSTELAWITPSGRGVVYSATTVRRKSDQGGDYNVALVDLAEGPRLMSRIDGVPPDAVKIGMPVAARVIDNDTGKLLVFVADGGR